MRLVHALSLNASFSPDLVSLLPGCLGLFASVLYWVGFWGVQWQRMRSHQKYVGSFSQSRFFAMRTTTGPVHSSTTITNEPVPRAAAKLIAPPPLFTYIHT
jgi:hypothetical protein